MAETYKLIISLALIMGLALASPSVAIDFKVSWNMIGDGRLDVGINDRILFLTPAQLVSGDCDVEPALISDFQVTVPGTFQFVPAALPGNCLIKLDVHAT